MGLGLAKARPQQKLIILDGDGALIMNLNYMTTAASRAPKKLINVVWDNGQFELTGGQPTHTAYRADLAMIARGAGFTQVTSVESQDAFEEAFSHALHIPGPWVLIAHIDSQRSPGRPPKSATFIKHRFMQSLGIEPA
jgi:thiamine pyrophosphate-dependent acetolactate synthase large subunit-like protein